MKILISAPLGRGETYRAAAEEYGAEAVTRYCPVFSEEYGALILAGGGDIAPALSGAAPADCRGIDYQRDVCELALTAEFLAHGRAVLAVCRGLQLVNVAFGGTLREVPDLDRHYPRGEEDIYHKVSNVGGIFLRETGEKMTVNSYHHQCIAELGTGLRATQIAEDGTIEGAEHQSLPLLAVQWHPERICDGEGKCRCAESVRRAAFSFILKQSL